MSYMKITYHFSSNFIPDAKLLAATEAKLSALCANLERIEDYSDTPVAGHLCSDNVTEIVVDFFEDPSAFEIHPHCTAQGEWGYIGKNEWDNFGVYEVLTREEAIETDNEINATRGVIEGYKVGEVESIYLPLDPDGKFFYRAL